MRAMSHQRDNDIMVQIVDLHRALEYKKTRRDVEELYYKPETSSSTPDISARLMRDEELTAIPNLVNGVFTEHYPISTNGPRANKLTRQQRNTLT